MRTTVALDDQTVAEAQELTGITEKSRLIQEALMALIAGESARRLSRLGRSAPDMGAPPRRRQAR